MKQLKDILGTSILQAIGASVVIWLWSVVMSNGEKWFGTNVPSTVGLVVVPLIFMITAVLAAGAVLGYPLYLVLTHQRWGKAITLIAITLFLLGLITAIILFAAIKY